jgi:hypothetical protein
VNSPFFDYRKKQKAAVGHRTEMTSNKRNKHLCWPVRAFRPKKHMKFTQTAKMICRRDKKRCLLIGFILVNRPVFKRGNRKPLGQPIRFSGSMLKTVNNRFPIQKELRNEYLMPKT